MKDLRERTIRAGVANVAGRAVCLVLRVASIVILGRLLTPTDYGLLGMVMAFTGLASMVAGFGLFQAAIQRDGMTEEQASTLFWANILLGAVFTGATLALAPALGAFYHDDRLQPIASVVGLSFLIGAAGAQHGALLQRNMRFGASAIVDIVALAASVAIAVGMAMAGYGYWALVSTTVSVPLCTTIGVWLASGWVPGRPRRRTGMRSMMHFGGTMTLNGLVAYVANNFDKMLLGRYWGAEATGIYGRAFSLIMFPTDNLNNTIGEVAFAALSRTKNDPERLRRYFLKGYSLVVMLTMPATIFAALFADDLIVFVLGSHWQPAAPIFRIMAPIILVFAINSPLGWLLSALGLVERGLKIALVSAPFMILAVLIGLPYGPEGVAIAYATVMVIKVAPIAAWAVHGTPIRLWDILAALRAPAATSLVAGAMAFGAHRLLGPELPLMPRLAVEAAVFAGVYLGLLLSVTDRKSLLLEVLRSSRVLPGVST